MSKNPLFNIFSGAAAANTAAAAEDKRRRAALEAVLAGPAQATISMLKNTKAAADRIVKKSSFFQRWDSEFNMTYNEGPAVESENGLLQKAFELQHTNSGKGLQFVFRENGTMQISPLERKIFTVGGEVLPGRLGGAFGGSAYAQNVAGPPVCDDSAAHTWRAEQALQTFMARFSPMDLARLQAQLEKPAGPQPN